MKKGFTLVELLVVVLIIAILAAIALPKYTAAVNKSRGVELLQAMNAMEKAQTVYYLENRSFANSMNELAIKTKNMKSFYPSWYGYNGSVNFYTTGSDRASVSFHPYVDYEGEPAFEKYCYGSDCQNYFSCRWGCSYGGRCFF